MKTAVCLLLEQDGWILGISRRNDATKWGLPGGKVDPSESNLSAITREIIEETGLVGEPTCFEPLYVGFCPGKLHPPVDYWVTTYLWVGPRVELSKLQPEPGFKLLWMTKLDLEDPTISPFADYNAEVFKAAALMKKVFNHG